ncbi:DUF2442 domain-containing protein [Limnohabitans sp.]|uniref:DUF2442 domain-containing protein n=1 Tax=Limnohabitans sp. TaxID=1907725 RepID=UPI003341C83C
MQGKAAAQTHRTIEMRTSMDWDVIDVKPVAPLALKVEFADGTVGKVQFEASHLTGVFAALKDPSIFQQAFIDGGAVAWPGNLDLAPDAMYQAIKSHGEWVLR